ncbi:MAG TPA: AraC family transcriptional regulator [Flavobacterium sp.]|uniref:helix-turn-helix transcriptional regulator n=1 Tax=unclassified Flavobacterium TaxID=196869 RepID=UPI000E9933C5|nr:MULTISPECIES: AraC family transcriptional regulator [unclassified Flavobacterium]HBI01117.1 AraC family transcriptional regulator [Flavobacterium sp.]HRE78811.1 AraC family transcriptional regulator [Flavobacterium sp.]
MNELFKIFKVEEAEATRISASPDEPHQHDFEELIIGIHGQLDHFIDFNTSTFDAPFISFVTKGKVHRVIPKLKDGKCEMWALRFKSEFIPETTFQLYSYYHDHATIKLQQGACFNRLITLCEIMYEAMQQEDPDLSVVKHLLSALFGMIESERNKTSVEENVLAKTQNTTLQNFLSILEENYHRPLGVEFYAEKLFMSARNLNLICKGILQQTVSEIIETRKLIEAKNQLTHSDKNISEIGFDLGYNEKAYFTNVFKKRTGQTPSEFRDEMKTLLS